MESFVTVIFFMLIASILVGVAQKIHIPYPIMLVIGGTAIGFIPGLPLINFDPYLILVIVLPPILYYAAFGISYREFKKNWRSIFSLALGLVFATTLVVGLIFKWLFPEFPWSLAFVFGAIVSPPDAIAATTILKRFSISQRLLTILEGESLINDASALILYRFATAALLTGMFSFSEATMQFTKVVTGGVLVGCILGFLLQWFSRRYLEPIVGVVFSFTIPYTTFILANALGVSGVLAVVASGLIGAQLLAKHHSSLRRVLGFAVWDIFSILLNCFVFILIGLQLRILITVLSVEQMLLYVIYALLITAVMLILRMVWVYISSLFNYWRDRSSVETWSQTMREVAVIGWSGMRGIVSLVAALGIPFTLNDGSPLRGRHEVIFITFVVILVTLLLPGLTLPSLLTYLRIHHHTGDQEANKIRHKLALLAEEKINFMYASKLIETEEFDFLKSYFHLQKRVLEISSSSHQQLQNLESIRLKIIQSQRKKLLEIWELGEIEDKLLIRLEHELDIEETHIARAELK